MIGLKENSNHQTGIVYVRTTGMNEKDEGVLSYVRWVMVRKRDPDAAVKPAVVPALAEAVAVEDLRVPTHLKFDTLFDVAQSGSKHLWDDYAVGEKIDHVDGITVEEAEHMMATRLYQNTARVHFNQFAEGQGRFGRRLIYGGHVISLGRAISFNGLGNALILAGINGGRHVNPLFAGDTVFAWSQVLDKQMLGHRKDVGLLRLRLVATKNLPCAGFPTAATTEPIRKTSSSTSTTGGDAARMSLLERYRASIAKGELKTDAAQERAAAKLAALAKALKSHRPGRRLFFAAPRPPRGLYLWGDVGRGKSMLMDLFFAEAPVAAKRRIHFNEFMVDVHAAIHAERQRAGSSDPIPPVGPGHRGERAASVLRRVPGDRRRRRHDLGRLFEQLFERGVVVVATSNTSPDRLYEGGLNRALFLPFIEEFKQRLDVVELDGDVDYRLHRISGLSVYLWPLGPKADAAMDAAWFKLTDRKQGGPQNLTILGRTLRVPQAAKGVARFAFDDLCAQPLAGADYLAVARAFHTVLIDRIPRLGPNRRDEARRFVLLIDTLYDERVKLICSAEAPPEALYTAGDGVDAFRRTVSRLHEMQSEDYLKRGHGVRGHAAETV